MISYQRLPLGDSTGAVASAAPRHVQFAPSAVLYGAEQGGADPALPEGQPSGLARAGAQLASAAAPAADLAVVDAARAEAARADASQAEAVRAEGVRAAAAAATEAMEAAKALDAKMESRLGGFDAHLAAMRESIDANSIALGLLLQDAEARREGEASPSLMGSVSA